ncbi:MAG: transglycosylase SLT domain-containing protein [Bilophila wadsworthia]
MRIDPQKLLSSCAGRLRGRRIRRGRGHCRIGTVRLIAFFAGDAGPPKSRYPRRAQHRATLIREARAAWGLNAPVSVFAAQIHTESWWRNDTVSAANAQGLAQFIPSTARWLPTVAPEVGKPQPFNPAWSLRACVVYDKYLWDRMSAMSAGKSLAPCDRMAFTLSGYNGGAGWVNRDRNLAAKKGLDPDRWFRHVETVNAGRKASVIRENRRYVSRIMEYSTPIRAG